MLGNLKSTLLNADYVEYNNITSFAEAVHLIIKNDNLYNKLVSNGVKQLKKYPSSFEKHEKLLLWFEEIINKKNY